ncbi:MAG: MBL fold metallo-hydrolase [Rhodospirillaceae bacterium]|nr:MBL fold metallo-hydrolase [Rhodospirillaceae bacterium]
MISHTIFKDRGHTWLAFGQDPQKPEKIIDTNQIVITSGDQAIVLDPGGLEIFPPMLAALTDRVPIENIKHLFMSHQDPDIGSSLPLWRQVCNADIQIHLSWLWTSFVAHFDSEANLLPIPDEGSTINLGGILLELIPAHYLHSSGNFSVYDSAARALWTGDIGAALMPAANRTSFYVEDFDSHVKFMEGFHKRWMGSTRARDAWINRVSKLDIDILTPQHGLFFKGEDVARFLDWFGALEVGSGIEAMGAGDTPTLPRTASPASTVSAALPVEDAPEIDAQRIPDPVAAPAQAPTPPATEPKPAKKIAANEKEAPVLPEYDESVGGYVFPDS